MDVPKFQKMKTVGYVCLAFAAILSIMIIFTETVKSDETLPLVYYWGGLGLSLLTVNAGKRIAGNAVSNRNNP